MQVESLCEKGRIAACSFQRYQDAWVAWIVKGVTQSLTSLSYQSVSDGSIACPLLTVLVTVSLTTLIQETITSVPHCLVYQPLVFIPGNHALLHRGSRQLSNQQIFLMSLICNVHEGAKALTFGYTPPGRPLGQGAGARVGMGGRWPAQQAAEELMIQYPEDPAAGPVVYGHGVAGEGRQDGDAQMTAGLHGKWLHTSTPTS